MSTPSTSIITDEPVESIIPITPLEVVENPPPPPQPNIG
ncbi:unnamed protein product, partial [Rotaria magnacalcarata]